MSCAAHCSASAGHFDRQRAEKDRKRYQRRGPDPTTRMILEALSDRSAGRTLLDVGGGIGILGTELLQSGVQQVVLFDATAAGLDVARDLFAKREATARLETRLADFADFEPSPHADLVTLDRVVCCYPDYERLLSRAGNAAQEALAWSYPRDRWYVRLGFALENLILRAKRTAFRTFVHSVPAMATVLAGTGLRLASRRQTAMWCIELWTRN